MRSVVAFLWGRETPYLHGAKKTFLYLFPFEPIIYKKRATVNEITKSNFAFFQSPVEGFEKGFLQGEILETGG
jgi:hypothetical protein